MDIQYFISKLSELEGVDGPGTHLEVVINNLSIKDKRYAPPPQVLAQQHQQRVRSSLDPAQVNGPGNSSTLHPVPSSLPGGVSHGIGGPGKSATGNVGAAMSNLFGKFNSQLTGTGNKDKEKLPEVRGPVGGGRGKFFLLIFLP